MRSAGRIGVRQHKVVAASVGLPATDDFSGSGANAGKVTTTGSFTWLASVLVGSGLVRSGGVLSGVNSTNYSLDTIDIATTTYTMSATLIPGGTNATTRMMFRYATPGNTWDVRQVNGFTYLENNLGAVEYDLGVVPNAAGDLIEVRVTPTQVRAYVNGVLKQTVNSSDGSTNTKVGFDLRAQDTGALPRADNLSIIATAA